MSESDVLAEKSERIIGELIAMPSGRFSVSELFWLYHVATKVRWGTPPEQEQRLFDELAELLRKKSQR